jgi:hypothetical protein
MEEQFTPKNTRIARVALFGEQIMEERDFVKLPVASGGPTWSHTGAVLDATDGDKGGGQLF